MAQALHGAERPQFGDLIVMGDHRLVVGDSSSPEVVRLLMGDDDPCDLMWADAPYGQSYAGGRGKGAHVREIANDDLPHEQLLALLVKCFKNAPLRTGAHVYECHTDRYPGLRPIFEHAFTDMFEMVCTVIWTKNNAGLGGNFRNQHEPILFGHVKGKGRRKITDRRASTVWPVAKDAAGTYKHPTQKPVALVLLALGYSGRRGDSVYDPFSGAGASLLACERFGARSRSIELDPRWAEVTGERWRAMTGRSPSIIRAGNSVVWTARS